MTYRVQEFARLAGVTVRTLHHYDRVGLLVPQHRSESGYRLYTQDDLLRLERIAVLRYLGLSLREIGEIVRAGKGDDADIGGLLRRQAIVLRERRDGIARVLRAVEAAEKALEQTPRETALDSELFQSILKEIAMQETMDWSKKYYSEEAQKAIDVRKSEWSPELQEKISQQWSEMFAKVEAAIANGVEPTSEEGRRLASEWCSLVGQFTGGNREVANGLNAMYADQQNWPVTQKQYVVKPELMEFIQASRR